MTNRGRQGKRERPLRYLDLSFEGRHQVQNVTVLNNGFRPHGGHRGKKTHPPHQYSFNKPQDYHQQLDHDIERLLESEQVVNGGSPGWAVEASREVNHAGESALLTNNYLATNRSERGYSQSANPTRPRTSHGKYTPPPSREKAMYYRPNRTHQYLTATDVKSSSPTNVEFKFGRPTRTTLLRARQRCNSAPVNSYDTRRESQKKADQRAEHRKSVTSSYGLSIKDLLGVSVPEGESLHSFLIGARYNRAHHLDAKGLTQYGVYMPRGNPQSCFVIRSTTDTQQVKNEVTEAPPVTPDQSASGISSASSSQAPSPPQSPTPVTNPTHAPSPDIQLHLQPTVADTRQAWAESPNPGMEVSMAPQGRDSAGRGDRDPHPRSSHHFGPISDGLNVRGQGFNQPRHHGPRAISARPSTSRPRSIATKGLPFVQGTSFGQSGPTPRHYDSVDHTHMANPPECHHHGGSLTVRDISEKLRIEDIHVPKKRAGGPKSQVRQHVAAEEKGRVPSLALGEHSVNGIDQKVETSQTLGGHNTKDNEYNIGYEVNKTLHKPAEVQESSIKNDRSNKEGNSLHIDNVPVSTVKAKRSRVRFADQLEEEEQGEPVGRSTSNTEQRGVAFFVTEDMENNSKKQSDAASKSNHYGKTSYKNHTTETSHMDVEHIKKKKRGPTAENNSLVATDNEMVSMETTDMVSGRSEEGQTPYVIDIDITSKVSAEDVSEDDMSIS